MSRVEESSDEVKVLVTRLWMAVLGADLVPGQENFLEAGGGSLQAMRLLSRIQHAYHVDVPIEAFFEAPTIDGLVRLVLEGRERSAGGSGAAGRT